MEGDTQQQPSDLVFDPDFNGPDGPILQSSDGVCFRVDLTDLQARSPLFANLSSLPVPDGEEQTLPFHDVSAPALKFVLRAMPYTTAHPKPKFVEATPRRSRQRRVNPWTGMLFTPTPETAPAARAPSTKIPLHKRPMPELPDSLKVVDEILYFADICEINTLVWPTLYESMKRCGHFGPGVMLAMSASTNMGNLNYWSTKCLGHGGIQSLDKWATAALTKDEPELLPKLHTLFVRWDTVFGAFTTKAKSMLIDGHWGFTRNCTDKPCACVSQSGGDFDVWYKTFLEETLFKYALASPMLMVPRKVREFCKASLPCEKCARRVADTANWLWIQNVKRADWTLFPTVQEHMGGFNPVMRAIKPDLPALVGGAAVTVLAHQAAA